MLSREPEQAILPLCNEHQISFHAYSPLAQGLLTGHIRPDHVLEPNDPRQNDAWWHGRNLKLATEFAGGLVEIGSEYGVSASSIAVAYLLNKHANVNVICGIRKEKHLHENIAGAEVVLPPNVIAELDFRLQKLELAAEL